MLKLLKGGFPMNYCEEKYNAKRYIISLNELNFFKELQKLIDAMDLNLLTQVSLYSLIETKYKKYNYEEFNKIKSKSIDFVIADKKSCRARVCIELDDTTHNSETRKKRDDFLNELFESVNIKLLHIEVKENYDEDIEMIKQTIIEVMSESEY
ncbi:MAG: DUF2726 domain-containing protein [Clostridiales bacterium]|nr:DUF2726 domain-containing protein [Clostridiales bacterium]